MATVLPPSVRRHRFSLEDYHRMVEAGILGQEDRVELIEGELVEMTRSAEPQPALTVVRKRS